MLLVRREEQAEYWDGYGLLAALVGDRSWVRRRVDRFIFQGEETVVRRTSFDIDLQMMPARRIGCSVPFRSNRRVSQIPIPLLLLEKEPLVGLDVRDEAGSAVPILTSAENGSYALGALVAAIEVTYGKPLTPGAKECLEQIVFGAPDETAALVSGLYRSFPYLSENAVIRRLIDTLASDFILFPLVDAVPKRRVIKIAYVESLQMTESWWSRLMSGAGSEPSIIELNSRLLGMSSSHHCEVEVPEGLAIDSIVPVPVLGDREYDNLIVRASAKGVAAHTWVREAPLDVDLDLFVLIRAERQGFLRASLLASVFVSLVLAAIVVGDMMRELGVWPRLVGEGEPLSFLLVIPGLLAAVASRPVEHRLASRLLIGVRACLVLNSVCVFAVAFLLVFAPFLRNVGAMVGLAFLSLLATLVIVMAYSGSPRG